MQNNNSTTFNIDEAYRYLDNSPMFKFSLSSKELFHSNFLEWLYNVDNGKFKKLIQEMAGLTDYEWPDNWLVKREYNNFDLCIVEPNAKNNGEETEIEEGGILEEEEDKAGDNDNNNEDGNFRILFVIENKVKSIPYREQLIRYAKEANSINEAYWKSKGKDVLARLGFNIDKKDWIGVKDSKWVLKHRADKNGRNGRNIVWNEPEIITDRTLESGVEGKSSVTKFLNDFASHNSRSWPVYYILLCLASTFPGGDKINDGTWELSEIDNGENSDNGENCFKCKWHVFYYSDYYKSIRNHFKISDDSTDLNEQIIKDYCTFLENLTNLVTVWQRDYKDYENYDKLFLSEDSGNYKDAKKHRIHDLYQKLKFSYLCAGLFNKIKTKYQEQYKYTVYPSNQFGLFKEKKDSPFEAGKDYICVNYTYLHGSPLLEINVHPKCNAEKDVELYYAIQVQGKAYEKGIQVKKNEVAERKLNHSRDANFSKTIWDSLRGGTIKLKVKNWMDINTTKKKPFNKYDMSDGSYIYQKEILKDDITINQVIIRMLDDLRDVVNTYNP